MGFQSSTILSFSSTRCDCAYTRKSCLNVMKSMFPSARPYSVTDSWRFFAHCNYSMCHIFKQLPPSTPPHPTPHTHTHKYPSNFQTAFYTTLLAYLESAHRSARRVHELCMSSVHTFRPGYENWVYMSVCISHINWYNHDELRIRLKVPDGDRGHIGTHPLRMWGGDVYIYKRTQVCMTC